MNDMVIIYEEDYCMDCNTEHSLVIYDIFNRGTDIRSIINNPAIIDSKEMSYIKCKNCNREYNIDWSSQTRIPRPLITNIGLSSFLTQYKQNNKYISYT
jgi:hypothetical protein